MQQYRAIQESMSQVFGYSMLTAAFYYKKAAIK
jgi:hypothetical protein